MSTWCRCGKRIEWVSLIDRWVDVLNDGLFCAGRTPAGRRLHSPYIPDLRDTVLVRAWLSS